MSYLDIEHLLSLRGSDTWSEEGNESQIMIRKAIGRVIHGRTPQAHRLPDAYYRFAENLSLHDVIVTFNYDLVLERALEYVGKPYRLFPERFKSIGLTHNVVDTDIEEVTVLKLHGSVDWFNNRSFLRSKEYLNQQGARGVQVHSVFDEPTRYGAELLVQGPRSPEDPLLHIYRIRCADSYYSEDNDFHGPLILSPSHLKFVYSEPLQSFWYGMGRWGGMNLGISIIGFSLPRHDEYIRVGLYQMISNYQESWWDNDFLGIRKTNVKLIDFADDADWKSEYQRRYSFIDPNKADYCFAGFDTAAVDFIFD